MKYKNRIRYSILKLLFLFSRPIYIMYISVFNKKRHINNTFFIESYYKQKLIIEVSPTKVNHYLPVRVEDNGVMKKRCGNAFVCGGNWEKSLGLIEDHRKTKDMYELFKSYENNERINETLAYTRHIEELKNNKLNVKNEPAREILDTNKKIDEYYNVNINLYRTIKTKGYATQNEVVGGMWNKEIGIAIGKNGEIYRYGNGYHRMAIAKFLKLHKVPVIIKIVHCDWYEKCCEKYKCDPIKAIKKGLLDGDRFL